jgi:hypothetical protein
MEATANFTGRSNEGRQIGQNAGTINYYVGGRMTVPSGEEPLLHAEEKGTLLESLRFDQIDARQMNIKNAYAKTCKWLLETSEYLNWLDVTKLDEHHGFLRIKGKPGAGKSTLMKFALANARRARKDRVLFSIFF